MSIRRPQVAPITAGKGAPSVPGDDYPAFSCLDAPAPSCDGAPTAQGDGAPAMSEEPDAPMIPDDDGQGTSDADAPMIPDDDPANSGANAPIPDDYYSMISGDDAASILGDEASATSGNDAPATPGCSAVAIPGDDASTISGDGALPIPGGETPLSASIATYDEIGPTSSSVAETTPRRHSSARGGSVQFAQVGTPRFIATEEENMCAPDLKRSS